MKDTMRERRVSAKARRESVKVRKESMRVRRELMKETMREESSEQEGSRVYRDCPLEGRQTRCRPCAENTFHRGLNGHKHCTPCTRCDAERGLRLRKSCTETRDALCEPMDGYFCRDPHEGGCSEAQRHSVRCSAGHRIGQKGTADKDTECLKCIHGTFSNGMLTSCQPHTKCESLDLDQIQPGTASTDSECGEHLSNVTSAKTGIIPIVVLVLFFDVLVVFLT
ncbi:unnamed protein product [Boreogadus saida]